MLKMNATTKRLQWTDDQKIEGQFAQLAPSLAAYNNKLYLVHTAETRTNLYISAYDGNTWSDDEVIYGQYSGNAPTLTNFESKACVPTL